MTEIIAAIIISLFFLLTFLVSKAIHRFFPQNIELSRKTVHVLGGLIALTIPVFIQNTLIVTIMCGGSFLFLTILGIKNKLQEVHGVERQSYGAYIFPIAILSVYLLANEKPHLYFISIIVLTFSDTAAALVGSRYGSIRFDVEGNLKSLEGSLAFFLFTFLCVEIPLLLMTSMDRTMIILIALIVAIVVTGFELISLSGFDNLFIPLGTFYAINRLSQYPLAVTYETLIKLILSLVIVFLFFYRFSTSLKIMMSMFTFAAYALCGFWWPLPTVFFLLFTSLILTNFMTENPGHKIQIRFTMRMIFFPSCLMFISAGIDDFRLLFPGYIFLLLISVLWLIFTIYPTQKRIPKKHLIFKLLISGIYLICLYVPVFFIYQSDILWTDFWFTTISTLAVLLILIGVLKIIEYLINKRKKIRFYIDSPFFLHWIMASATLGSIIIIIFNLFLTK
ncbi:MAG: hypothetical protein JXR70_13705 [Spirochaetales bacterium]|nr:hypothetical protein [Spirochaetales bacterium]